MEARNELIQELLTDLGNKISVDKQSIICQEIVCLECMNEDDPFDKV